MEEQPELWEPLTKFMKLHPRYLEKYQETLYEMLYSDAPLSSSARHFIALMGAARHRCQFLMDVHRHEFLRLGGDEEWLRQGIPVIPVKIQRLDKLNRILAHQPWLIHVSDLQALTRCPSPDNWSPTELLHAAIILGHSHALCSFVNGCGIVAAPPNGSSADAPPAADQPPQGEVALLMARMRVLDQLQRATAPHDCAAPPVDNAKTFADISLENSNLRSTEARGNYSARCASSSIASKYTKDLQFQYVDFVKRNEPSMAHTFKIHDYSWEDQGYCFVHQFCSQLSDLLDGKFALTKSLTYYTMGAHSGVDTSKYRGAVWNYIQSLYGIRHDDYDYAEVNQLLSRAMKSFIKTVCCHPHTTTTALIHSVMPDFHHSEKVHVVLMILEARLQSEMLYLLRALMRFMT